MSIYFFIFKDSVFARSSKTFIQLPLMKFPPKVFGGNKMIAPGSGVVFVCPLFSCNVRFSFDVALDSVEV